MADELFSVLDRYGYGAPGSWWWTLYDIDTRRELTPWRECWHEPPQYKGPKPNIGDVITLNARAYLVRALDPHQRWNLFVSECTVVMPIKYRVVK